MFSRFRVQSCEIYTSQSSSNNFHKATIMFYLANSIIFLYLSLFAPSTAFPATPLRFTGEFTLPSFPTAVNRNQPNSTHDLYLPSAPEPVNQSTWTWKFACNPGPGTPLDEYVCPRAINKILLQTGSTDIETFGTEGTYTGPHSWAWGTCGISIDVSHVRALRNSLLLFAKSAVTITDLCDKPGSLYHGGFCSFSDPSGSQYLRLTMARVPAPLSSVPSISSTPAPANATVLQTEKITCSRDGSPIFDLDCMMAVDQMLLQVDSTTTFRFGRLSTYSGPHVWTHHSCSIYLFENPQKIYIGSIAEFTTYAATISSNCDLPGKTYYGGTWASFADEDGVIVVQVKVARNEYFGLA